MPSISITPLPRQAAVASPQAATAAHRQQQPGQQTTTAAAGKNYVICEICDGYIKVSNHSDLMCTEKSFGYYDGLRITILNIWVSTNFSSPYFFILHSFL